MPPQAISLDVPVELIKELAGARGANNNMAVSSNRPPKTWCLFLVPL